MMMKSLFFLVAWLELVVACVDPAAAVPSTCGGDAAASPATCSQKSIIVEGVGTVTAPTAAAPDGEARMIDGTYDFVGYKVDDTPYFRQAGTSGRMYLSLYMTGTGSEARWRITSTLPGFQHIPPSHRFATSTVHSSGRSKKFVDTTATFVDAVGASVSGTYL